MSSKSFSRRFWFSDWPNLNVPRIAVGVYAIWKGDELIYCGMSGRNINSKTKTKKKKGLITRLASHAKGRLSGNQFCVYVANRLVIPSLTVNELALFTSGKLTLDAKTREFIHKHLEYAYALVPTAEDAYALEREARDGTTFGQKPSLNPL